MAAKNKGVDVFHRHTEFQRQEVTEAGRVQNAGHADNFVMGQAGEFAQRPDHGVQRVGDADHKRVGCVGFDALANGFHHFQVDAQQIVAAHAGFAGHTCGDDADISAGDVGIIIGAGHCGVKTFRRAGFGNVERLALRNAVCDVEHDDVTQLFESCEVGECATDLTCADKGNLGSSHDFDLRLVVWLGAGVSHFAGLWQECCAAAGGRGVLVFAQTAV